MKTWIGIGVATLVAFIGILMAVIPVYGVWSARLSGEAQLAEAMSNRRIKIQEAEAQMEAATHLATAEVNRAKGVAEANRIIGASLHENEAYLRYLWVQNMSHETGREVIYVPTEAGMPILEASRLQIKPAGAK